MNGKIFFAHFYFFIGYFFAVYGYFVIEILVHIAGCNLVVGVFIDKHVFVARLRVGRAVLAYAAFFIGVCCEYFIFVRGCYVYIYRGDQSEIAADKAELIVFVYRNRLVFVGIEARRKFFAELSFYFIYYIVRFFAERGICVFGDGCVKTR